MTCVSLYQECNGFGGSKPAQPGTIDLSGLPAPTPNSVQTSAVCNATASKASTPTVTGNAQTDCMIKTYLETDTQVGDEKFTYESNAQQFALEVSARKASILLRVINTCKEVCPTLAPTATQNVTKSYNALGFVVANGLNPYFDEVARPGIPVSEQAASISLARFCTIYADVGDQNHCKELETAINEDLQSAANELRSRKHELGLDVPFMPKATKTQRSVHEAKRRSVHPLVLLDGSVTLRAGHRGELRLNFPHKLRNALKKARRHRVIHGVLVVQASVVEGATTTHSVTLRIRLR
jgi:hypothetical protein